MRMLFKVLVVVLVVAIIAGASFIFLTSTSSVSTTAAAEPTGGQWSPIVLNASSAIRLQSPPSKGSVQMTQELNQLHAIQANRTTQANETVAYWNSQQASVSWNEIARSLVMRYNSSPIVASRVYALVSVAQYDSLIAVYNNKYTFNSSSPHQVDSSIVTLVNASGDPSYPSDKAAVAAASAAVLSYLYPNETAWLSKQAASDEATQLYNGVSFPSDVIGGERIGNIVAQDVISRAKTDGSNAVWNGTVPTGPGKWYSVASPPQPPLNPLWGNVTPWWLNASTEDQLMTKIGPPPTFNSTEYNASLKDVKDVTQNRTAEQLQIAQYWADGSGTYTPSGHWNAIASGLIKNYSLNELRAARTLALLNTAMMDSGIECWRLKYTYWEIRPSEADPTISLSVYPLPNFPSYTSGHSGFSAAASAVLGYIFPKESSQLNATAQQASLSRLYGGIHYRIDCNNGLIMGNGVAQYAIQRGMRDGSPQ